MKLNKKLKKKIDKYFETVKPKHLLNIAVNKYNFTIDKPLNK